MVVKKYGPQDISNGGTYSIDTRTWGAIVISQVRMRWKGRSTYQNNQETRRATRTASNYATGTDWTISCNTSISLDSGETFVSGYRTTKMTNNSGGVATNVYLAVCEVGVLTCPSVTNGGTCTRRVDMAGAGNLGACLHNATGAPGGIRIDGFASVTYDYIYYYQTETKTGNTSGACNGKTCSRTGTLNNGVWSAWVTAPADFLKSQTLNNIALSVGGSGISSIEIEMTYTAARPTAVKTMKIRLENGTSPPLPLCALTDVQLDYGTIVRVPVDGTTYCADLVATNNAEASGVRISTHKGVLSWRRLIT
jgi:hypothetical protein